MCRGCEGYKTESKLRLFVKTRNKRVSQEPPLTVVVMICGTVSSSRDIRCGSLVQAADLISCAVCDIGYGLHGWSDSLWV
jgi:hypothetical protein